MLTAFIPAKSISKRIYRKNLIDLGGKPLIWWTLEICKRWGIIDKIVVATDDDGISEYASMMFAAEIYPLKDIDIDDQRTVSQLWKKFCETQDDNQVLLHITNPFRRVWELEEAWQMYITKQYDVVISVKEDRNVVLNENLKPTINWRNRMSDLTQYRTPRFSTDGSFYFSSAKYVRECNFFEEGKVFAYPVSKIGRIEIDNLEDIEMARLIVDNIDWWSDKYQIKPSYSQ